MAFDREIIDQVVAACQAGLGEASQACARGLDLNAELTLLRSAPYEADSPPPECAGAGLLFVLKVEGIAALVVVPEASGLVPSWSLQPDATGRSKLATLAVEWGMLLLPEAYSAMDGTAGHVRDLSGALKRAGIENGGCVSLQSRCGDQTGVLTLIWPANQAAAALVEPAPETPAQESPAQESPAQESSTQEHTGAKVSAIEPVVAAPAVGSFDKPSAASVPASVAIPEPPRSPEFAPVPESPLPPPRRRINYEELEDGIAQLPAYSRSLLKIRVPVTVTLAESRQPLDKVLDIGPGSIIHFNKPCEDTLTLEVAGQRVAVGEAVKVGDKFGLWITSMILPDERFWVIGERAVPERAK